MAENKNVVLIMGQPNTGKTTSLYFLDNPEKYVYLNTDMKETPFRSKFAVNIGIEDPVDILGYIDEVEDNPDIQGIVIDTLSFMMDMFETQYISEAADSRKMWGEYAQFYKKFIHKIKSGTKDYIILAHEDTFLNEKTNQLESKVPVKGAVGKIGVEADFTTILSSKTVEIKRLQGHENSLLNITPDEEADGSKRVFVTRISKEFAGGKMRSAMGLWDRSELFIDNNIQQVLDRLKDYYK